MRVSANMKCTTRFLIVRNLVPAEDVQIIVRFAVVWTLPGVISSSWLELSDLTDTNHYVRSQTRTGWNTWNCVPGTSDWVTLIRSVIFGVRCALSLFVCLFGVRNRCCRLIANTHIQNAERREHKLITIISPPHTLQDDEVVRHVAVLNNIAQCARASM